MSPFASDARNSAFADTARISPSPARPAAKTVPKSAKMTRSRAVRLKPNLSATNLIHTTFPFYRLTQNKYPSPAHPVKLTELTLLQTNTNFGQAGDPAPQQNPHAFLQEHPIPGTFRNAPQTRARVCPEDRGPIRQHLINTTQRNHLLVDPILSEQQRVGGVLRDKLFYHKAHPRDARNTRRLAIASMTLFAGKQKTSQQNRGNQEHHASPNVQRKHLQPPEPADYTPRQHTLARGAKQSPRSPKLKSAGQRRVTGTKRPQLTAMLDLLHGTVQDSCAVASPEDAIEIDISIIRTVGDFENRRPAVACTTSALRSSLRLTDHHHVAVSSVYVKARVIDHCRRVGAAGASHEHRTLTHLPSHRIGYNPPPRLVMADGMRGIRFC